MRAMEFGTTGTTRTTTKKREEDFVGACRVCLFDVTREDIRDARAIRLGCACVSGVVHVDAECLEAWVLRAPRKSRRLRNLSRANDERADARRAAKGATIRREKYRARTVSSSSSASARDDDARDDDARARRLGNRRRANRRRLARRAVLPVRVRSVGVRVRRRSRLLRAQVVRVRPHFGRHRCLPCSRASRYCSDASLDRRGERRAPIRTRRPGRRERVSPRRRRRSVPRETRSTNVTRVTARSARASTRRNGRDDRASGARFVRERGALVLESTAK